MVERGIAYSGGGLTALAATMCTHRSLVDQIPSAAEALVSAASGGSLGYLLHQSTLDSDHNGTLEYPPPLSANVTYEQLCTDRAAVSGHVWWGNALKYVPDVNNSRAALGVASARATANWWRDVMHAAFYVGYGVAEDQMGAALGLHDFTMGATLVRASGCPLVLNSSSGVALGSNESLRHVRFRARRVRGGGAPEIDVGLARGGQLGGGPFTLLDGVAWSTSFWAASIVESGAAYAAELAAQRLGLGLLIRGDATLPAATTAAAAAAVSPRAAAGPSADLPNAPRRTSASEKVYLGDGGFVDSSSVVALLRRRVGRIFLSYNNNDDLRPADRGPQSESASVAYLFGVPQPTDSMNSLPGPALLRVFDPSLYPAVIANLTDPTVMRARLTNVVVQENAYLDVPRYVLDELYILSNQRPADGFFESFADPAVRAHIDPRWPNRIPVGLSAFDANLLCQFGRWKLRRYDAELRAFFHPTTGGTGGDSGDARVASATASGAARRVLE